MITPIAELRSRARMPSTPSSSAAATEPTNAPATTLPPISNANAAPANDSSLMPCTAKGRSRAITTTLMMPPSRPRTAPAISELRTRGSSAP